MPLRNYARAAGMFAAGMVLVFGGLLSGCKNDAQFSEKEQQQFKEGPPKEMPPEARKMFEDAMKSGQGKGQPGAPGPAGAPPPAPGK